MLMKQIPWLTPPPRTTILPQAGNRRILPETQIRRSQFFTAAQGELFDRDSESDPAQT